MFSFKKNEFQLCSLVPNSKHAINILNIWRKKKNSCATFLFGANIFHLSIKMNLFAMQNIKYAKFYKLYTYFSSYLFPFPSNSKATFFSLHQIHIVSRIPFRFSFHLLWKSKWRKYCEKRKLEAIFVIDVYFKSFFVCNLGSI